MDKNKIKIESSKSDVRKTINFFIHLFTQYIFGIGTHFYSNPNNNC